MDGHLDNCLPWITRLECSSHLWSTQAVSIKAYMWADMKRIVPSASPRRAHPFSPKLSLEDTTSLTKTLTSSSSSSRPGCQPFYGGGTKIPDEIRLSLPVFVCLFRLPPSAQHAINRWVVGERNVGELHETCPLDPPLLEKLDSTSANFFISCSVPSTGLLSFNPKRFVVLARLFEDPTAKGT